LTEFPDLGIQTLVVIKAYLDHTSPTISLRTFAERRPRTLIHPEVKRGSGDDLPAGSEPASDECRADPQSNVVGDGDPDSLVTVAPFKPQTPSFAHGQVGSHH
jgi:hypothetical protein